METWSEKQLRVIEERDKNIMVSAAAGAGKTSVLVERIFKLITDPKQDTDIDRLLIMTFTRDAAGEMRERIISRLDNALGDNPSDKRLRRQKMLAHNARIVTIDSFCNSLVKEFFYLIDLDPVYRIGEAPELALISRAVLSEVIEDRYEKREPEFIKLVECFSDKKSDKNLEVLINRLYSAAASAPDPVKRLISLKKEYHPEGSIDSLEWIQFLMAHSDGIVKDMIGDLEQTVLLMGEDERYGKASALIKESIRMLKSILESKTYEERYNIISTASFGTLTAPKNIGNDADFWEQRIKKPRNDVKERFNKTLKDTLFSQRPEKIPVTLLGMSEPLDCLIDITCEYYERLLEKKKDKAVFDFNDIAHFALQILEKEEARISCRERYREVFIDEYQDSNSIQESLAEAITGEQGVKPFLFTVGDVKQSIYRFRMAKPKLFTDRFNSYRDFPECGTNIVLDCNYRSYPLVLSSTNDVFFLSMDGEPGGIKYDEEASLKAGLKTDPDPAFENRTSVLLINSLQRAADDTEEATASDNGASDNGYSDNGPSDNGLSNNELEAAAIVCEINRLLESGYQVELKKSKRVLQYSDITLLFRNKTHMDTFKKVFEKHGIPVYMQGRGDFFASFEVRTVMNFLSLLGNPRQDIALAGALHSPLFGLSSQELSEIRIIADISYDYYEALCTYRRQGTNSRLKEKLEHFFEVFEDIRSMNLSRDIDKVIAAVINRTGFDKYCSKLPNSSKRLMNLELLLASAEKYEISSYSGLFSFVRYVDRLMESGITTEEAAAPVGLNAVRFTTMHSSKGLEYPVVFVVGCCNLFVDKEIRPGEASDVIISPEFGIAANYIDLETRTKSDTAWMTVTKARMHNEYLGEEMRLLYVAMTRARQKLYLTGCMKLKQEPDSKGSSSISRPYSWDRMTERIVNGEKTYPYAYLSGLGMFMDVVYPAAMANKEDFVVKVLSAYDVETAVKDVQRNASQKDETGVEKASGAGAETGVEKASGAGAETGVEKASGAGAAAADIALQEGDGLEPLPIKLSVSAVKKASMLDYESELGEDAGHALTPEAVTEEAGERTEQALETAADSEKSEKEADGEKHITGAMLGTLYHKVCRFIPYSLEPEKVNGFLDSLVEKAIISVEEKEALKPKKLELFLKSRLAQRMAKADALGRLKREQPFVQGFPAEKLLAKYEGRSELIPVQGVIDCFFYEADGGEPKCEPDAAGQAEAVRVEDLGNGGWVLVDYKTDRIGPGEGQILVERYRKQFELYRDALESVSGVKVKEMLLYSFALGETIPVT